MWTLENNGKQRVRLSADSIDVREERKMDPNRMVTAPGLVVVEDDEFKRRQSLESLREKKVLEH
jgi:hypothetical protein